MQMIIYNKISISQKYISMYVQIHFKVKTYTPACTIYNISCCFIVLIVAVRSYNTLDYELCALTNLLSNQNTLYQYIILIGRVWTTNTILVFCTNYGGNSIYSS